MTIYICETLSNYTVKLVSFIMCKLYINSFDKEGGEGRGGAGTPSPPLPPPRRRVTLEFKTFYKCIETKTVWYYWKDRPRDRWNRLSGYQQLIPTGPVEGGDTCYGLLSTVFIYFLFLKRGLEDLTITPPTKTKVNTIFLTRMMDGW